MVKMSYNNKLGSLLNISRIIGQRWSQNRKKIKQKLDGQPVVLFYARPRTVSNCNCYSIPNEYLWAVYFYGYVAKDDSVRFKILSKLRLATAKRQSDIKYNFFSHYYTILSQYQNTISCNNQISVLITDIVSDKIGVLGKLWLIN